MNKLLMLGALAGIGFGAAKYYMKKKHQDNNSSGAENMTQQPSVS